MNKQKLIKNCINDNGGYLFTSSIEQLGISRTTIATFVKENGLERVAHGVYVTPETWSDELYVIQLKNPKTIFSGETALYLHGMIDREYSEIRVSVPRGYNGSRLRKRGIIVHQENDEFYALGISVVESGYGHNVRLYDRERCICDLIAKRQNYEVQNFQTAIKTYMRSRDKKLSKLMDYSSKMGIRDEVMKYVEVLV